MPQVGDTCNLSVSTNAFYFDWDFRGLEVEAPVGNAAGEVPFRVFFILNRGVEFCAQFCSEIQIGDDIRDGCQIKCGFE